MDTLKLTLPDGSEKQVTTGTTGLDIAQSISPRLADAAVAVMVNGKQWDLKRPLPESGAFRILTTKDAESLEIVRHSSAHLMAQALVELFPGIKLAIGPVIENGFYYDVDSTHKFTPDDFPAIETKMAELAEQKLSIDRHDIGRLEAIEKWGSQNEPYKVEMMQDWTDDTVSFYTQGSFFDLCRGPHVPHTGFLKFVKLLSVAGAYWRGDEKRPMLQRIYATAFHDKKALDAHCGVPRGGEEARSPRSGAQARAVPHAGRQSRHDLLAPAGLDALSHPAELRAQQDRARRVCRGPHAQRDEQGLCGKNQGTGTSTRKTCS